MSDTADLFKKLAQGRQKSTPAKVETTVPAKKTVSDSTPEEKPPVAEIEPEPTKKRGRPATGKRSDPDWIGRTYYIRKETDFDIEDELIKLKREGISLDKSELVENLLAAWVKWRKGENIDIQISEISPRRKDKLS